MKHRFFLLGLLFLLMQGCTEEPFAGFMPVVGLDDSGKSSIHYFGERFLVKKIHSHANELHHHLVAELDEIPKPSAWHVNRIRIGFGVHPEFGIGLVSFEARALVEFWITRNTLP